MRHLFLLLLASFAGPASAALIPAESFALVDGGTAFHATASRESPRWTVPMVWLDEPLIVQVLEDKGDWLRVSVRINRVETHCAARVPYTPGGESQAWIERRDLRPVISTPVHIPWPDGTSLTIDPGAPVNARGQVEVRGLKLPFALPEGSVGESYARPAHKPADDMNFSVMLDTEREAFTLGGMTLHGMINAGFHWREPTPVPQGAPLTRVTVEIPCLVMTGDVVGSAPLRWRAESTFMGSGRDALRYATIPAGTELHREGTSEYHLATDDILVTRWDETPDGWCIPAAEFVHVGMMVSEGRFCVDRYQLVIDIGCDRPIPPEDAPVSASATTAALERWFARRRDAVKACTSSILDVAPDLVGRSALKLVIDGQFVTAVERSSGLDDPRLEQCLTHALTTGGFGRPIERVKASCTVLLARGP